MRELAFGTICVTIEDVAGWQIAFEELLPGIRVQARFALRHLFGHLLEEALQEVICTACVAFARWHEQGRTKVATASSLTRFAVRRYRIGRRMAERTNVDDVSSPACQLRKGGRLESLIYESAKQTILCPKEYWRDFPLNTNRLKNGGLRLFENRLK